MTGEQSELNEILDLSLIADILQILNFWLNLKQVSSDALMQELKNQDSSYLDKLIEGPLTSWMTKMLQRAKQSDTMLLCTVRNRLVSSKLSLLRKEL